jgi:hypothetical protein
VATLVLTLRATTRFDERAYPGSSWSTTPDAVFHDFDITLPACTDGRVRYWAGSLELYVKITAAPACITEFTETNRLTGAPPSVPGPVALTDSPKRQAEFGWQSSAQLTYLRYRREENNVETQAVADEAPADRSLFLHAWHQ